MNIRKYRGSFRVYVLDQQEDRRRSICDILSTVGYSVRAHESIDSVLSTIKSDPPHFVILGEDYVAPNEVKLIMDISPESHLIAVVDLGKIQQFFVLLSKGLYDVIGWPLYNAHQLVAAVDRGAERDYFMYENEQMREELQKRVAEPVAPLPVVETLPIDFRITELEVEPTSSQSADLIDLGTATEEIFAAHSIDQAVEVYLKAMHQSLAQPVCLFKYLPARRSLFLTQVMGLPPEPYRGLGVDFSKQEENFSSQVLRQPEGLSSLRDLVNSAFKTSTFAALPVDDGEGIKSVVVVLNRSHSEILPPITLLTRIFGCRVGTLSLQGRLHSMEQMDPVTQVWNRQHFEVKLQEEMSRSRRTHLPLSMVIASVDEFKKIRQQNGQEVSDLLLRSVAGMIRRNSRVNDVVGRLSESEIALLLPHTGSRGGAIKAERLRRMVEAADFTKLFGSAIPITISLGVSEYPSVCRDADELLKSADDALFQVKDVGSNKVCIAPIPEGFVADFEVGPR